ncbi:Gfo/Idh/MocA family oxidoreductase [Fontisphaera persica]|uniref:Gfo/Idh/MocA family protein n=1 Tax=Fontisphaera persica TaxID=2974023 RepID=UPI0024BF6DB0|nr:Gfo/Idh/MocA family oxidoreductase [Fontisphaera persica]WCJ58832.1 Gfo/Idh/MocA family oxidoreductase [Fontisphaera persica]
MSKTVNVGVIGLGFMGVTHLKALQQLPQGRVVAVCDAVRRPENGQLSAGGNVGDGKPVALDMSVVRVYQDYRELLADPQVEAVDICLPTPLHPEVAVAALAAGKYVLCEKPMARTSALGRTMVEAAQKARGFLMPAMCMRFWPGWTWLKNVVESGQYGRVLAARFRRVAEPPGWSKSQFMDGQKSGGALLDLHIHDVDFVQYCFGRPQAVYATGYTCLSGAIDHVVAQYRVASGAMVYAEGGWAMAPGFGFSMSYTVNFERATADYDVARGAEALKVYVEGQPPVVIRNEGPDGYVGELAHFLDSILAGRAPTVVTAADGLSAIEICEAEEASIASGQPQKLAGG